MSLGGWATATMRIIFSPRLNMLHCCCPLSVLCVLYPRGFVRRHVQSAPFARPMASSSVSGHLPPPQCGRSLLPYRPSLW